VISPEANAVTVWQPDTGQHVCTIEQDAPAVALFDDGDNKLWIASQGTVASCIEMPRQSESFSTAAPGVTTALTYAPDGTLAWSGMPVSEDLRIKVGDVGLWVLDPLTGTTRIDVKLPEVCRVAFDADSSLVAAIGEKAVYVWSIATGEEVPESSTPFWPTPEATDEQATAALEIPAIADACRQRGRVKAVASGDGKIIAIDHGRQLVSLWNVPHGTEIVAFSTVAAVQCMAFSADGTLFSTGDARSGVMLWRSDGTPLGRV
jgi:WD40 repeat protein